MPGAGDRHPRERAKALRASMTELAKEVRLAASYGELSETLQLRIEVVMRFFLALGEGLIRQRRKSRE